MGSAAKGNRLHWVALFAVLLFAASAVPVLADEPSTVITDEASAKKPTPEELAMVPTWDQVREGLEAVEQGKEARETELDSPRLRLERERSRLAFADLGEADSRGLLGTYFSHQLASTNSDPARFLSGAQIVASHGSRVATVENDGDRAVLDSTIPLRVADEEGDSRKVDLTLEGDGDSFEPRNPLAELDIPRSSKTPIDIGDAGLALTPPSMFNSEGSLYGDLNVFYPEVLPDTDRLVAPVAGGVETFDLLRSERSPEVLEYELDLPQGATLLSDGSGGAEVIQGESPIAHIPFPTATDSQGTQVPVEMDIVGESLVLRVLHRQEDIAYPVLVDPWILQDWYYWSWSGGWGLEHLTNGSWWWGQGANTNWLHSSTYCIYACWDSGRGLFISSESGTLSVNSEGFGQWNYPAPNSESFLQQAWISPFHRSNHNCPKSSYPHPHDYAGMWDGYNWTGLTENAANDYGHVEFASWGRALLIGLGNPQSITVQIPCWRDIMAGGVAIWLDDWARPSITASSNSQWMDSSPIRLNVSASDSGLGVQAFETKATDSSGNQQTWWTENSCYGTKGSLCPHTWDLGNPNSPFLSYNPAALPEGERTLTVVAYDATEKPSLTDATVSIRIDHAAPVVSLTGTVTEQASLGTEHPSYTIRAEAKDGVSGSPDPADMRSGAARIIVKNDGQVVDDYNPGCSTQSCAVHDELEVPAAELSPGPHTLSVTAKDAYGHTSLPKEVHYTTGDGKAPDLDVSGLPEMSPAMPRHASYWDSFGSSGVESGQFSHPADVAVDNTGDIWVVDEFNNRVQKFNDEGAFLSKFGTSGTGDGQFNRPTSLAVDGNGDIWVTDAGNGRVQQFNDKGEFLSKFGSKGSANGQFASAGPEGIATDPQGNVWVSDTYAGRIQEFNQSGELLQIVGSKGTGSGQLGEPTGLDFDSVGNLWAADWQNNRVAVFDPSGQFVRQFGSSGTGNGQFARPDAIAVGANGDVWVGDQNNGRVQEFDLAGEYVGQFGSKGSGEAQFSFGYPMGLAVDSKGSIWIADTNNNRIQHWLIPNTTLSGYLDPIVAEASDDGFGVESVVTTLRGEDQSSETLGETTQECPMGGCSLDLDLDEVDLSEEPSGAYLLAVSATDHAGNVKKVTRVFTLDSAPPEIALTGSLAESAGGPLETGAASLEVTASDADPESGGVEAINIERDHQLVASFPSDCSGDCHEVEASYGYRRAEDGADRELQPVADANGGSKGELTDVSCTAVDGCWAIGSTRYTVLEEEEGKSPSPLLSGWDGAEWEAVAVPVPESATDAALNTVNCKSASVCVATGYYNDGSIDQPMIELWLGTQWSRVMPPTPNGASGARLEGVSCGSTNLKECWLIGRTQLTSTEEAEGKSELTYLQRWNGAGWEALTAPAAEGATDNVLNSVFCVSGTECMAVGGFDNGEGLLPLSEMWDGSEWSEATPALPDGFSAGYLTEVSCGASESCWAVGRTDVSPAELAEGKADTAFFEHWNGGEWQAVPAPVAPRAVDSSLTSIACASESSCTAAGSYEDEYAEVFPLAYTWNGEEWRFQPVPSRPEAANSSLEGISCTAPIECVAVGYSRFGDGSSSVLAESESPGHGPHLLTVEAVDAQGNAESETIEVDVPQGVAETPECETEVASEEAKGVLSPGQAVESVEESIPNAVAPSEEAMQETTEIEIDPSYTEPQPDLESEGSLVESETSVSPDGGVAVGDVACVVPNTTTPAATNATVVNDDAAVFANTAPETDSVVRPTAGGTLLLQSLRGPDAPDSFSWTVEVSDGQELVELPSGAVALVQEPADGEPIEEIAEIPTPEDAETEKVFNDAGLQLETTEHELVTAQAETDQEVVAVIAKPWVVLSQGVTVPAKIEITPVVYTPIEWEIEVTIPTSVIEEEVWPVGLAMEFLSSFSANGHCSRKVGSPCGAPDLDRAARYAVYWGNEAHHDARNPKFEDYGSNDCTNFISQILRAAGMKFMRFGQHGDGSWWAQFFNPLFGAPAWGDTESWRLADKLPRHLWRFGLVHIDPVQKPWGWTKGNIIATDWFGTNGKGDVNHLLFVVGQRHSGGHREPLLANHSTDSYSAKPWALVKARIEKKEGSSWTRFALAVKHTNANLNAERNKPENLYDSGGLDH